MSTKGWNGPNTKSLIRLSISDGLCGQATLCVNFGNGVFSRLSQILDIIMADKKAAQESPIPLPPERFLIGNLHLIDPAYPIGSFNEIAAEYGPIVKISLGALYLSDLIAS